MIVVAVSLAGALLFGLPFITGSTPAASPGLAIGAGMLAVLVAAEVAARRLDSRRFALLMAIAAIDSALRLVIVLGVLGFSPIFFLVLCAGYVYGAEFGFLSGATALFVSALVTGGVGPWLPYEMLGVGGVGAAAGLAGRGRRGTIRRRDLLVLAIIGTIMGWVYGAVLDLMDWANFYRGVPDLGWAPGLGIAELVRRFGRFYAVTSLVWDTFRAIGNAVLVLGFGLPVLTALRRLHTRFSVEVVDDVAEIPAPTVSPAT
jgi:energy-coupling factor transport system substrate-specific component